MRGLELSPHAEDALLKSIPSRGYYSAVKLGAYHGVVWRHGVSEKVLLQFLAGPNVARTIASNLNFVHEDQKTGETMRNFELLKIAWWDGRRERRIILPGR